jgi:hypothetical protein
VTIAIAREQITALLGRTLLLTAMPEIDESLDGRSEADAEPES